MYVCIQSPRGLNTLAKELTAATRVLQSSLYELSTLVSGKAKNVNKRKLLHNALLFPGWSMSTVADR